MLANKRILIIPAILCACILYGIAMQLRLQSFADDFVFSHALDHLSLHDYILQRYFEWSGRLTIDALMVSTINHQLVWRVGIPVSVALLCLTISQVVNGKVDLSLSMIAFVLLLLIPKSVMDNGAWWVTGFYNYLLPVMAMAYSLSVLFRQNKKGNAEKTVSIACLLLSCFNEQTVAFTAMTLAFILILKKDCRTIYSTAYACVAALFSAIMLMAPGNYLRFNKEIWRWMPGFDTDGLVNKITLGFDRVHQAIVMHDSTPFTMLCIIAIILIIKNGTKNKAAILCVSVLTVHLVIIILSRVGLVSLNGAFYSGELLNPQKWMSYSRYVSYLFCLSVILSITYSLAISACKRGEFLSPLIIFIISFATVIMIGFSPTVYSSGMRVLFLWNVITVCVCIWSYNIQFPELNTRRYLMVSAIASYIIFAG